MSPGRLYEGEKEKVSLDSDGQSLMVVSDRLLMPRFTVTAISVESGLDITLSCGVGSLCFCLTPRTTFSKDHDNSAFLRECDVKVEDGVMYLPESRRIEAGNSYVDYGKKKIFKRRKNHRW